MTRTRIVGIATAGLILIALGWWLSRSVEPSTGTGKSPDTQATQARAASQDGPAGPASKKTSGEAAAGEADDSETSDQTVQATVFGRVLMADNHRPVAGAKVVLREKKRREEGDTLETVTDASGDFTISGDLSGPYLVFAEKDTLLSFRKWRSIHSEIIDKDNSTAGPITLYLHPTHQLTLKIISEETKAPVPEASLKLLFDPGTVYRADQRGMVALRLSPEIWNFEVAAPGFQVAQKALDLHAQEQRTITLALQPAGVCSGKVVDPDGLPLEEVRVNIPNRNSRISAVTGPDGQFLLDHLPLDKPMRLFAQKHKFESYRMDSLTISAKDRKLHLDIVLKPREEDDSEDLVLTGLVVDEENHPVAGARIFPMQSGDSSGEAFSAADGSFRLQLAGRQRYSAIWVEAEGYASTQVPRSWDDELGSSVRIVLERAHWLKGRVVDGLGSPVAGASIYVQDNRSQGYRRQRPWTTDADGGFFIEGISSKVDLTVTAEDFSLKEIPNVAPDQDDFEIVLSGLGVLLGKVVDKKTGEPVPEFTLVVRAGSSNRGRSANINTIWSTDGIDFQSPDGSFLIDGLTVDYPVMAIVKSEAYPPHSFDTLVPKPETEAESLLFSLDRQTKPVAGVVVDSLGQPRPGVSINLLGLDPRNAWIGIVQRLSWSNGYMDDMILLHQTAVSNEKGEFRFEKAPLDLAIYLLVDQDGLAKATLENLQHFPDEQRESLLWSIPDEGRLNLVLNRKRFPDNGWISVHSENESLGGFSNSFALNPGQELVTIGRLSAKSYRVQWHSNLDGGSSPRVVSEKRGTLSEGETHELRLGFEDLFRVAGIAYNNQRPLIGQGLALQRTEEGGSYSATWQTQTTDDKGGFVFEEIEKGAYDLVLVSGGNNRYLRFPPDQDRNKVSLGLVDRDIFDHFYFQKSGSIHGRLLIKEMTAMLFLQGLKTDRSSFRVNTVPDATSSFLFEDVPPGTYSLSWTGGSFAESRLLLTDIVMPDDGSDVDLGDIKPDMEGSLRIWLRGELGQTPTRQVHVQVYPLQMNPEMPFYGQALASFNEQDDDGLLFLEKVPSGQVKVVVGLSDQALAADPTVSLVNIVPGETTELQVSVEPVTMLTLHAVQGVYLAGVRLTHTETGTVVELQEAEPTSLISEDMPLELAFFTTSFGIARNLAEGEWSLLATDAQERSLTRVVNLVRGKAVMVPLKFE